VETLFRKCRRSTQATSTSASTSAPVSTATAASRQQTLRGPKNPRRPMRRYGTSASQRLRSPMRLRFGQWLPA
jgi:hypothetical protein